MSGIKQAVAIPQSIIEKIHPLGPHFCKCKGKNPSVSGKGWQKRENLMYADNPKLQTWLRRGENYGIVGGYGLIIVDADINELKQVVKEKLPETFTVESPGSHGWHYYFHCALENPIRLRDKDGENVGDIQGLGKMVVGPGSIHPNGGIYRIVKDIPIAQVTRKELVEAFEDYVVSDKEIERIERTAKSEKTKNNVEINILTVLQHYPLHRQGNEYFGKNPIHDSKTGKNFWVNPEKNCWHCFRHGTGGGPLSWIAVEEKIIKCSEAIPGALRGAVYFQVLRRAQARGLVSGELEIEETEEIEEDEQIREEVDALIEAPNLLEALTPYLDDLIAGEDENKKLLFTLLLGGKIDDISLKQIILLKGEAGGGKTTLMKLASLFRTKNVGRFTRHAIEYSDLDNYEILMIKELGYIDRETAESGISVLKFLSADDEGFTVEFTVRDEDNRFTTEQRSIPPITVISSTTRIDLDKQFERRAWTFSPDESIEQTERIRRWKVRRKLEKNEVILNRRTETSETHSFRVLQAFVNCLEPINVILPFPNSLMQLLSPDRLRVRGDYDKIIALITLYGFANQHKLPMIREGENAVGVVVTPEIALEILKIGKEPFATMTVGLERRTLRILKILRELEGKSQRDSAQQMLKPTELGLESEFDEELLSIDRKVIEELAMKLQLSKRTIIEYLKQWCASGWITPTERTYSTQPWEFKMLYPTSEIEKKLKRFEVDQSAEQLVLKIKKEAKESLKPALQRIHEDYGNFNLDVIHHFT